MMYPHASQFEELARHHAREVELGLQRAELRRAARPRPSRRPLRAALRLVLARL